MATTTADSTSLDELAQSQASGALTEADGAPCRQADRAYTTVFFDLDGTLLPLDTSEFMEHYMGLLLPFMGKHGYDPMKVKDSLMAGIVSMSRNEAGLRNDEAFWLGFNKGMGWDAAAAPSAELEALFLEFYDTDFRKIGDLVTPDPAIRASVEALKAKGYRLAVATMPMFPTPAVNVRIGWAGLDPEEFLFATDYESSRSVKPKPGYYLECVERAGVAPQDVLMVGNNTLEDGAITAIGADIYILTDHLIKQEGGVELSATKHGSSADFTQFVESLPSLA